MPKKSTKKKLSKLQIFALSSLALLILIIGGTYCYVLMSGREDDGSSFYETILNLRVNPFIKEQSIKDTLTYTLPAGWTDDAEVPYPKGETTVLLGSSDYKFPKSAEEASGVTIGISTFPKYVFMTLNELKQSYEKQNNEDWRGIEINGVEGIRYEYPTGRSYIFIKGNYMISIRVDSYNSTYMDGRYTKDINSIINSIQFK